MVKVMIFDDDRSFLVMLKKDLEVCGYNVIAHYSGADAVDHIVKNIPDLILINSVLPVKDGKEIVAEIRKLDLKTPAIFLSSDNDVNDVVNCFEAGGNDYVRKPIELRELLARIKNQLPKNEATNSQIDENECFDVNGTRFDYISNSICQGDRICQMTKKQASIVRCLMIRKGQVVPFETIVNECFNTPEFSNESMNCMKVILCKLRKNLENNGISGLRIETYRKKGICLYV